MIVEHFLFVIKVRTQNWNISSTDLIDKIEIKEPETAIDDHAEDSIQVNYFKSFIIDIFISLFSLVL